jgi:hypothetical protein
MKENDLNERIIRLKERLSKLKHSDVLNELPADRSPQKEQKIRKGHKIVYKKYNYETKL